MASYKYTTNDDATVRIVSDAADLTDFASDDIDLFLDSVLCDPFTDAQMDRILRNVSVLSADEEPVVVIPLPRTESSPAFDRRLPRVTGRATQSGRKRIQRLTLEELEKWDLPSLMFPIGAGAAAAHFGGPPPAAPVEIVRSWQDRQVIEMSQAEEWMPETNHCEPLADASALDSLFADADSPWCDAVDSSMVLMSA